MLSFQPSGVSVVYPSIQCGAGTEDRGRTETSDGWKFTNYAGAGLKMLALCSEHPNSTITKKSPHTFVHLVNFSNKCVTMLIIILKNLVILNIE